MKRILSVEPLPAHQLRLRYNDGVEGVVNLSVEAGKGLFAAWEQLNHFNSVQIVHNGRSLEWPGGIDLCADALYLEITGKPIEELFPNLKREAAHA